MLPGRMSTVVDPVIGRCVGGDFDVQRLIAAGGVGSVYEAVQRSTGKLRAIKLMHAWLLRDEKMRNRFVDEARIAGSVESDHVVEVVSAGIDSELGVPWIAMELLRGQTLADHIERHGAMSYADCLEVMQQARHGLQMAHRRNLVHRDIKPENIFVADARRVGVPFTIKVLDFGIAKWVHDARESDQNSQIIGTPSWMAPEQLSNVASITPATDVWALGLLAFWLLSGREYWLASNDERSTVSAVLLELVSGARVPPSLRAQQLGIESPFPPGFDAWFARTVDLDPSRRFPDAASCVDALAPLLATDTARSSTGRAAIGVHRSATTEEPVFDTRELDSVLDHALMPGAAMRADWAVHAATAALGPQTTGSSDTTGSAHRTAHRTARRLDASEIRGELFFGAETVRDFFPLADLLAAGLGPQEGTATPSRTRPFPDRVQESVRHVCLVLGVHPAAALVATEVPSSAFVVVASTPPTLGVPASLLEPLPMETLRAHASVGVARTLAPFSLLATVDSIEALESARKAAVALARGAVSSSPLFRRMVGRLGPRRAELAQACQQAEGVATEAFFTGAVLTLARLALLGSADRDAARAAIAAARLDIADDAVAAHLDAFIASPAYETYWHRRGA